jgi:nucleoside-triphosphatase THEP1
MESIQNRLILWTGKRHSGKTTSVARLAQKARDEGFNVCGLLAPCVYLEGKFVGYDVLDLRTNHRTPLARCKTSNSYAGPFNFITEGFKLSNSALSKEAVESAELIIVDEFGKLELNGRGWRKDVDSLLVSSDAVILLVVRLELADAVRQLYADIPYQELSATEQDSIDNVITMLKNHCRNVKEQNVQA